MPRQRNLTAKGALACLVVLLSLCTAAYSSPRYKLLHGFTGADGFGPYGGVILGPHGELYGTTVGGGSGTACIDNGGCGVVFVLTPRQNAWQEKVLYSFCSQQNCVDGNGPQGGLLLDAAGNIYGTTFGGGTGAFHNGTVFELTRLASGDWSEQVLLDFDFDNGADPTAGLIMDSAGNLYGTTPGGGTDGGGIAFELTPGSGGWSQTVLHSFPAETGDGSEPYAGLIAGSAGSLYGTTLGGGTGCAGEGCGVVYQLKLRPGGDRKETILHRFDNNGMDGVTPGNGTLFIDRYGDLYGTTETGGCCGGVVFRLIPKANGQWGETILHTFQTGPSGNQPYAGVVMDKEGNLYGTTDGGGSSGCGVIYKLAPKPKGKWKYSVLYNFSGGVDGCVPAGNLVIDKKGNLYGGTVLGGQYGQGVIFEITP